jgi:DNA polymerase III epsilon subunit-like protein
VIVFCDTETTGLDPKRHQIWEVGLIDTVGAEHVWTLPVDLGRADAQALKISGFHARYGKRKPTALGDFARLFRAITEGCHLAGAVISFDEERLRYLLRANGECPLWHYHLVDVEAFAAGKLGLAPPWDSDELSQQVGVDPGQFDRHSALGDARWAKAIYEAVVSA